MLMRIVKGTAVGVVASLAIACGGVETSDSMIPPADGAADTSGTTTPSKDSGGHSKSHADAGVDTGGVTGQDSGSTQPGTDGAVTKHDGLTTPKDAKAEKDTGKPPTRTVPCGQYTCAGTKPVCCFVGLGTGSVSAECVADTGSCPGGSLSVTCSTSADCPSGDNLLRHTQQPVAGHQRQLLEQLLSLQRAGPGCDPASSTCPFPTTCVALTPQYGICEPPKPDGGLRTGSGKGRGPGK